jgi:predicted lactoylglutathione lyase
MDQRVSIVTLGVADVGRSRAFYEALGLTGHEAEETVFFQAGGLAVILWGREKLAADARIADDLSSRSGGIMLAHNVGTRDDVDAILRDAQAAGGVVTKPAEETFYGGYAGHFRDPDGHVWEIAHNPSFTLNPDGTLTLPDFS